MDEKTETEIENLTTTLAELKEEISRLRKQGKDPFVADYLLRSVKSKIMYYKASEDKEDLLKIKRIFEDARKEIQHVKGSEVVDAKKEVYQKAGIKLVSAEE